MKTKGRNTVIVLGVTIVIISIFGVRQWSGLSRWYTLWRLDNADTWEKAVPLLEALAADANRLDDPGIIVGRLGAAHQRYTFWFFAALQHESYRIAIQPKVIEPFQALQIRLKDDPELMTMWIQFLRWQHDSDFLNSDLINRSQKEGESALARVELARILAMPEGDEKRLFYFRWVSKNAEISADVRELNPPPLPFPEWSGPVFTVPSKR